jgi:nuclear-control-of-ATPase protein 2
VKVDIELAMNGIEKMLQSQQLTFAFVGVAPSLIVLAGLGRWVTALAQGRRSVVGKDVKRATRAAWSTMRRVDKLTTDIVSSSSDSSTDPKRKNHRWLGLLLIEAQRLREYASSPGFPKRAAYFRSTFLEVRIHQTNNPSLSLFLKWWLIFFRLQDVRDLEDGKLDDWDKKKMVTERIWRTWAVPLGWARLD